MEVRNERKGKRKIYEFGIERLLIFMALYCEQKEGMGLLEYQAVPFLRNVAHDAVLCTFSNR